MTYRQDADFRKQYGAIWKIKEPPGKGNGINTYINNYGIDHDYISQNKTKKIAWFVSNCHSKSGREKYVKELQKYIEVVFLNTTNFSISL